ncbi:TonB-dependent receptor [Nevskia ramosa]|uniref:TonB-dependent receptor n=1 Tax=Nevskia ramosa TaxID=64002 RepID=UPI003D0A21D9
MLPVLVAADLLPTTDGTQRATGKYSALLPKIGLRYRLAPEWTLFATYSEAYRAGGAEVLRGQGTINEFKPEYTRNYEVGFRATPWQKVGINLNVYHVDWRDQQVATIDSDDGFDYSTKNAANSVLDGAELETRWQPLRGLELYLSSGYAHTRFKDFVDNGQDFSGNQFVDAPRFSGSVGGSYRHRTGAFVSLSYSSTAAYYSSPANAADERGDIRRLLDARLGYQGQRLAAYLYGRNLLDDDTVKSSVRTTTGLGITEEGRFVSYGTLRRLGVQLEARF